MQEKKYFSNKNNEKAYLNLHKLNILIMVGNGILL